MTTRAAVTTVPFKDHDWMGDWYFKQLSGQWIDITGIAEGDYIVHVEINAAHTFPEGTNCYTNVIETTIHMPDPRNKVTIDNSPAATD
jgi:hypothetical protein